jgi:hypothetical protein
MYGYTPQQAADAIVVENNLLGGSEWLQTEKTREHGADVLPVVIIIPVKPVSGGRLKIKLMQPH